jgi:hypothetical protein
MTTLKKDRKRYAAEHRQRANSASSMKIMNPTVELLLTDQKTQRKSRRKRAARISHRRDRQTITSPQCQNRPSNRHTRVHRNGSHHLRGFLPWRSSVASR